MSTTSNHLLGIDPKMYRHFAVMTVAISSVIALFANGDAQEAMAQGELHSQRKAAEARASKAKLVDNRSEERRSNSQRDAFHGQFGAPMDGGASAGGNSGVVPIGMAVAPSPIIIEVDQKMLAQMTPQQRAAYMRRLEEERQRRMEEGPVTPTPEQVSALAAQSAARSGSDEID